MNTASQKIQPLFIFFPITSANVDQLLEFLIYKFINKPRRKSEFELPNESVETRCRNICNSDISFCLHMIISDKTKGYAVLTVCLFVCLHVCKTTQNLLQWLKWFCEAGGGGRVHLTMPGWSKPHTHSNHTNLALFRHKITLYRFNQRAHTIAGGLKWEQGDEPPHFNH